MKIEEVRIVEIWSKQNGRKPTRRKGTKRRKNGIFNLKRQNFRLFLSIHLFGNIKEKRKIKIDTWKRATVRFVSNLKPTNSVSIL
jgi:hypothetical protein